jgi:uncharacterized protein (DUF1499 family)
MRINVLLTTILCLVLTLGSAGCSGKMPANLGVRDGRLAPCPATPNCVSSQSSDPQHAVEPLAYTAALSNAHDDLRKIILGMKRATIKIDTGTYIHAEFSSAAWRFVDDVEFYFDDAAKIIHLRSASRLGSYDFGVNRERVESIRALWEKARKS